MGERVGGGERGEVRGGGRPGGEGRGPNPSTLGCAAGLEGRQVGRGSEEVPQVHQAVPQPPWAWAHANNLNLRHRCPPNAHTSARIQTRTPVCLPSTRTHTLIRTLTHTHTTSHAVFAYAVCVVPSSCFVTKPLRFVAPFHATTHAHVRTHPQALYRSLGYRDSGVVEPWIMPYLQVRVCKGGRGCGWEGGPDEAEVVGGGPCAGACGDTCVYVSAGQLGSNLLPRCGVIGAVQQPAQLSGQTRSGFDCKLLTRVPSRVGSRPTQRPPAPSGSTPDLTLATCLRAHTVTYTGPAARPLLVPGETRAAATAAATAAGGRGGGGGAHGGFGASRAPVAPAASCSRGTWGGGVGRGAAAQGNGALGRRPRGEGRGGCEVRLPGLPGQWCATVHAVVGHGWCRHTRMDAVGVDGGVPECGGVPRRVQASAPAVVRTARQQRAMRAVLVDVINECCGTTVVLERFGRSKFGDGCRSWAPNL